MKRLIALMVVLLMISVFYFPVEAHNAKKVGERMDHFFECRTPGHIRNALRADDLDIDNHDKNKITYDRMTIGSFEPMLSDYGTGENTIITLLGPEKLLTEIPDTINNSIVELFRWKYRVIIGDNCNTEETLKKVFPNALEENLHYYSYIAQYTRRLWQNAGIQLKWYEIELLLRKVEHADRKITITIYDHFSYIDKYYPKIITEEGELYELVFGNNGEGWHLLDLIPFDESKQEERNNVDAYLRIPDITIPPIRTVSDFEIIVPNEEPVHDTIPDSLSYLYNSDFSYRIVHLNRFKYDTTEPLGNKEKLTIS